MANEILVVELATDPNSGGARVVYAFLHPVSPAIVTATGVSVIPTPTSELPEDFAKLGLLQGPGTQPARAALDLGELAIEIDSLYVSKDEREKLGAVRTKLRRAYAASEFVPDLRSRYQFTGTLLDAS